MVQSQTLDINKIPLDDKKTWELIQSGYSNGVFQLESKLCQHALKKIKPANIWELMAVISIIRPGASSFMDEYIENKKEETPKSSFENPIINEVLQTTNNVILYQEQLMSLGRRLAWRHLSETDQLIKADKLRKAVGKKNQKDILEIGKEFVDGCIKNEVDQATADRLFSVIRDAGRYSFNSSHACSYAYVGYLTAYLKCHYPLEFLATYLSFAQFKLDKWEEIYRLIQEARILGINTRTSNINSKNKHFKIDRAKKEIIYGQTHIKYVTDKAVDTISMMPQVTNWKQFVLLFFSDIFGPTPNSKTAEALISVGAFSPDLKISRKALLSVFKLFKNLSEKELEWALENIYTFGDDKDSIKIFIAAIIEKKCTKRRKPLVESELKLLDLDQTDSPAWIEHAEKNFLGIALSATSVDTKELASDSCVECHGNFPSGTRKQVIVVIKDVIYTVTKKGKNPGQKMARINVYDSSGELNNLPVFPELYLICEDLLVPKNNVKISIKANNYNNGWIAENIEQA